MDTVGQSSYDKFIKWYLKREKREKPDDNPCRVPWLARNRREFMRQRHSGKLKDWFENANWSIVRITQDEFDRLIPIEDCWTKKVGLTDWSRGANYRLLRNVAYTAIRKIKSGEISLDCDQMSGYRKYYPRLKHGHMHLEGNDRIVLRSLEDDERFGNPEGKPPGNPRGLFYLHDGWGRSLPYQMLLKEQALQYTPVEAFLACRRA